MTWIIVYLYKPMYSSPTFHPSSDSLRNNYHPLFDEYNVDLVLQAHNHNYQRSYPIRYNFTNSSTPVITDFHGGKYRYPQGPIFMIIGTAGADQYNFTG